MHIIYWADDDQDDLDMYDTVLGELTGEYKLVRFENGRQVLNFLPLQNRKDYPCVIILDMVMPVMDGRETLSVLKSEKNYRYIPVVVLTTLISEQDKLLCKRLNAEIFMKPSSYARISEVIQNLLGLCIHA
jgi:CheY-like chemotaxis protein